MRQLRRTLLARLDAGRIAGVAMLDQQLVTWGDRLLGWEPPYTQPRVLWRGDRTVFGPGGCAADVNGDGRRDLIVTERLPRPALVWYRARTWTRHVIEAGVEADDVTDCVLYHRRGALLVHRRGQVRFYSMPQWVPRDIYSFYTPSDQGGLLLADLNGDGLTDIICGNYWIQSPPEFDLPWRLFAVNTWNEEKASAMLSFAWSDLGLFVCQREMSPARLALFERPPDVRQLWRERRLDGSLNLNRPRILKVLGRDLLVSESGGEERLILFRHGGAGAFEPAIMDRGLALLYAHSLPGDSELLGVGPSAVFNLAIR